MVRATALILFALAGCDRANSNVCVSPPSLSDEQLRGQSYFDWAAKTDACVAKWALRLGRANASVRDISEAVIGGCTDAIDGQATAWAQLLKTSGQTDTVPEPDVAMFTARARRQATFFAIVARAGNCPIP